MEISINGIVDRYQAGFGFIPANADVILANRLWGKLANIPLYSENQIAAQQGESDLALFKENEGRFADMLFTNTKSGNKYGFGIYDIKRNGIDYSAEANYLAPPPMVSFTRDKNVVVTEVDQGIDGSGVEDVVESFGLKSFKINIQGILIDMSEHQYPSALVQKINQFFSERGTYKVESRLFSDMGIVEIFLTGGFEVSFVEGFVDTVKFAVSAMSTKAVELKAIER